MISSVILASLPIILVALGAALFLLIEMEQTYTARLRAIDLEYELQVAQYEREIDGASCTCSPGDDCPYHRAQALIDGTDGKMERKLFVKCPQQTSAEGETDE